MIYWIEHAPNPWVRAIAIGVLGGISYFHYYYQTDVPNIAQWLGGYGACASWSDEDDHRFAVPPKALSADAKLLRDLGQAVGPVAGHIAFVTVLAQTGRKLTDAELVAVLAEAFPAPKHDKKA